MFSKRRRFALHIRRILFAGLFITCIFITCSEESLQQSLKITPVETDVYDRISTDETRLRHRHPAHITCEMLNISEEVVITKNPEYYLSHTAEGERIRGGSLVVDERYPQNDVITTICGHNTNRPNHKLTNIAGLWKPENQRNAYASYYNGYKSERYDLWGAFQIDQHDTDLAYPNITHPSQITPYLSKLSAKEGWKSDMELDDLTGILLLFTCSEPLLHAPHRTLAVFIK